MMLSPDEGRETMPSSSVAAPDFLPGAVDEQGVPTLRTPGRASRGAGGVTTTPPDSRSLGDQARGGCRSGRRTSTRVFCAIGATCSRAGGNGMAATLPRMAGRVLIEPGVMAPGGSNSAPTSSTSSPDSGACDPARWPCGAGPDSAIMPPPAADCVAPAPWWPALSCIAATWQL